MAWFVYDLKKDEKANRYHLVREDSIYTKFEDSLYTITRSEAGDVKNFIDRLQDKIDRKLDNNNPPDTETIDVEI